jgi:hypothetical protein
MFQEMCAFLGSNSMNADIAEEEVVAVILALAAGDVTEAERVGWLRDHIGGARCTRQNA